MPPEVGLVDSRLNGIDVPTPRLDLDGRPWLGANVDRDGDAADPDRLTLEVIRRIDDDIPLRMITRMSLDVSGRTPTWGRERLALGGLTAG